MISIYEPWITVAEKAYVNDCLESGWISSRGDYTELFRDGLCDVLKSPYVLLASNGTTALMLALSSMGAQVGSICYVPSFTYTASVSQALHLGMQVKLFDSTGDGQPALASFKEQLELDRHLKGKVRRYLVLPSLYGNCAELDQFHDLCFWEDICLVHDAAENFGSTYKGIPFSDYGEVTTYSFFANKVISTGEGACLVFGSGQSAYEHARTKNNQAHIGNFVHNGPGFNFRMTNIQAAIGLGQLEKYELIKARKAYIASVYERELPHLYVRESPFIESTYWMPLFRTTGFPYMELRESLIKAGVDSRPGFTPVHLCPGFEMCSKEVSLTRCEDTYWRLFNLPCYPTMTDEQLDYVVNVVKELL